jgi:hypothetical protein
MRTLVIFTMLAIMVVVASEAWLAQQHANALARKLAVAAVELKGVARSRAACIERDTSNALLDSQMISRMNVLQRRIENLEMLASECIHGHWRMVSTDDSSASKEPAR